MKKLYNRSYGAKELKKQINSSTMKGFILSLMFFLIFGLAISSLNDLVNDNKVPEIKDIPITVISNYKIEKSFEKGNIGKESSSGINSSTEEIARNQKFTEVLDLPATNASIIDVNINTDDIVKNLGSAFGLERNNGLGNINSSEGINNSSNGIEDGTNDITKEFVYQEMQKLPSMDYDKIKNLVNYPSQAKALNLNGIVHIAALVDKSGKLAKSYIYSSTNSLFNEEALQAVKNYNDFSPAVHNERTVDCWIIIPIKFKLK
ncbi:MAG: energy transducer TonB [Candidatus Kapaibacterium sp.]